MAEPSPHFVAASTRHSTPSTNVQRGFASCTPPSGEYLRSIVPYIRVPRESQRIALPNWPSNTTQLAGRAHTPFNKYAPEYELSELLYDIEQPMVSPPPRPPPRNRYVHTARDISHPWMRHIVVQMRQREQQREEEFQRLAKLYLTEGPDFEQRARLYLDAIRRLRGSAGSESTYVTDSSSGSGSLECVGVGGSPYIPTSGSIRNVLADSDFSLTQAERQWLTSLLENRHISEQHSLTMSLREWYSIVTQGEPEECSNCPENRGVMRAGTPYPPTQWVIPGGVQPLNGTQAQHEEVVWKEVSYSRVKEHMDASGSPLSPFSRPADRKRKRVDTPSPPAGVAQAGPLFNKYRDQHTLKKKKVSLNQDLSSYDDEDVRMSEEHFSESSLNQHILDDNEAFLNECETFDSMSCSNYSPPRPLPETLQADLAGLSRADAALRTELEQQHNEDMDQHILKNKVTFRGQVPCSFSFTSSGILPLPERLPATVQAQLVLVEIEFRSHVHNYTYEIVERGPYSSPARDVVSAVVRYLSRYLAGDLSVTSLPK